MAGAEGAGGGDEIRLEEGFAPSAAGTVDKQMSAASQGTAAAGFSGAVPEGADPLSAAVLGKMVTWPEEMAAMSTLTGKKAGQFGAAAAGTDATLKTTDAENAVPFQGIATDI